MTRAQTRGSRRAIVATIATLVGGGIGGIAAGVIGNRNSVSHICARMNTLQRRILIPAIAHSDSQLSHTAYYLAHPDELARVQADGASLIRMLAAPCH